MHPGKFCLPNPRLRRRATSDARPRFERARRSSLKVVSWETTALQRVRAAKLPKTPWAAPELRATNSHKGLGTHLFLIGKMQEVCRSEVRRARRIRNADWSITSSL